MTIDGVNCSAWPMLLPNRGGTHAEPASDSAPPPPKRRPIHGKHWRSSCACGGMTASFDMEAAPEDRPNPVCGDLPFDALGERRRRFHNFCL